MQRGKSAALDTDIGKQGEWKEPLKELMKVLLEGRKRIRKPHRYKVHKGVQNVEKVVINHLCFGLNIKETEDL